MTDNGNLIFAKWFVNGLRHSCQFFVEWKILKLGFLLNKRSQDKRIKLSLDHYMLILH